MLTNAIVLLLCLIVAIADGTPISTALLKPAVTAGLALSSSSFRPAVNRAPLQRVIAPFFGINSKNKMLAKPVTGFGVSKESLLPVSARTHDQTSDEYWASQSNHNMNNHLYHSSSADQLAGNDISYSDYDLQETESSLQDTSSDLEEAVVPESTDSRRRIRKKSKKLSSTGFGSELKKPAKKPKYDHQGYSHNEKDYKVQYPTPSSEALFGKKPPAIDLNELQQKGKSVRFDPVDGPSKFATPGVMCTPSDPHYMGIHYGIHKCKRSVSKSQKRLIAELYGVPESNFRQYEFDHLIPLGLGGSNHPSNIWPQFRDSKHKVKADLAGIAHRLLISGKISQKEAITMIFDALNRDYNLREEKSFP